MFRSGQVGCVPREGPRLTLLTRSQLFSKYTSGLRSGMYSVRYDSTLFVDDQNSADGSHPLNECSICFQNYSDSTDEIKREEREL